MIPTGAGNPAFWVGLFGTTSLVSPDVDNAPMLRDTTRKCPTLQLLLLGGFVVGLDSDGAEPVDFPNKFPTMLVLPTVGLPATELSLELPPLEEVLALGLGLSTTGLLLTFKLRTEGLPPLEEELHELPSFDENRPLSLRLQYGELSFPTLGVFPPVLLPLEDISPLTFLRGSPLNSESTVIPSTSDICFVYVPRCSLLNLSSLELLLS